MAETTSSSKQRLPLFDLTSRDYSQLIILISTLFFTTCFNRKRKGVVPIAIDEVLLVRQVMDQRMGLAFLDDLSRRSTSSSSHYMDLHLTSLADM